ncbi:hypothetical protein BU14_0286s0006 [Porphyra umbilicalis]|uniref:NADAR domain-containing protein n=1 Tax=Porphyra umbilicalis TaxID=2786 RepID=A0A1X6P1I2_PORUM|nr:hypothetical protein BU14_0286s0006 [Porphyra umbilicalis]|eukprot:OSX74493.1 hypothetical protein BU14_0286s0006 [Porphyra umbilicalis]
MRDALVALAAHDSPPPAGMTPELAAGVATAATDAIHGLMAGGGGGGGGGAGGGGGGGGGSDDGTGGRPDTETLRLAVGALLADVLAVASAAGPPDAARRLCVYSAHDTTLLPLLLASGVAVDAWVPYASAVVLEVYDGPAGPGGGGGRRRPRRAAATDAAPPPPPHTRVTDHVVLFYTAASLYSNFHDAPFTARPYLPRAHRPPAATARWGNDVSTAPPTTPVATLLAAATDAAAPPFVFGHTEQWVMAAKAALFRDDAALAALLTPGLSAAAAKRLGRGVVGFDEAAWVAAREEVMFVGCLAKFAADGARAARLVATGGRRLAEASPRDRVWGIGLGIRYARAEEPAAWRGRNLLGAALERVRAVLAAQPR